MSWKPEVDGIEERRRRAGELGGAEAVAAQRERGRLTVRERIDRLLWRGSDVDQVLLEPPLLASFYGSDGGERRPVAMDELPEQLVRAVLAVEDAPELLRSFAFREPGPGTRDP